MPTSPLAWIVGMGIAMAVIALSGSVTLILPARVLDRVLLPLVAFAAGTLLGGGLFHLLPAGLGAGTPPLAAAVAMAAGFVVFLAMEQTLGWHHGRNPTTPRPKPLTYLILLGDGLHNFLGGLGVGAAFVVDVRLGLTTWLAAAAHEVPQEIGDFAVLVHGGWPKRRALAANFLSGSTFLLGGLVAYWASARIEVALLMPFAAGNFLYIAAADLVPEITRADRQGSRLEDFVGFLAGLGLMYALTGLG